MPIKISELTNVNTSTNDYQPMTKLPLMPQNLDPIPTKKKGLAVDQMCENLQIPFASFVDRDMIRKERLDNVINTTIGKELDGVKRKFHMQ